jgi:general secretion pathway protein M
MEMLSVLKNRWHELQSSEQRLLLLGALVVGLLAVYLLIFDPVYAARNDAEQRLRATQEAFSVAQQQALDLRAALANPVTPQSGSLLTQVESSAQQQGLRTALRRLQPSGDNQIQVSLEGAAYGQLMQWLSQLHQQGIRAQRVEIQPDRGADLVGAQLLLSR